MRFKLSFVALAVMALACAGLAQDQGGQGGQGGGGRRQGGMQGMRGGMMGTQRLTQLLRNTQVQTELKVTDDQKTKIEALPRGGRGPGGNGGGGQGGNGGGQGGGRQAPTPMTAEEQAKQLADDKATTSAILTPEQETRLEQLRVQWAGSNAVYAADVQTALGLSDDQKTKLADLRTKMGEANTALFEKMRNQEIDREAGMATMTKNSETFKTEVDKVLTADQKTKLKAMGGTELKMEMQQGGRGGFGGGRGGNGGGNTPPPQA